MGSDSREPKQGKTLIDGVCINCQFPDRSWAFRFSFSPRVIQPAEELNFYELQEGLINWAQTRTEGRSGRSQLQGLKNWGLETGQQTGVLPHHWPFKNKGTRVLHAGQMAGTFGNIPVTDKNWATSEHLAPELRATSLCHSG